jgi:hypothetical protein
MTPDQTLGGQVHDLDAHVGVGARQRPDPEPRTEPRDRDRDLFVEAIDPQKSWRLFSAAAAFAIG